MSNDVEFLQSFVRKYINKVVREHFKDIDVEEDSSLSTGTARKAIKRICLHKDKDSLTLTVARLLIWWVEAKGLLEDVFYAIPTSTFHESVVFKPQIVIEWRESKKDAQSNNRYPTKARYSIRWRGDYSTRNDIDQIRTKINNIFNKPNPHFFTKGKEKYSYKDKAKGYEFIVSAKDETEAKKVINSLLEIQDDNPLNEDYLTKSTVQGTTNTTETVKVNGETFKLPKRRPIGKVTFNRAEFKVHGMTNDILLTDRTGVNLPSSSS